MFRGFMGLKTVPEVIMTLDGYKKFVLKLFHESRHFRPTPNDNLTPFTKIKDDYLDTAEYLPQDSFLLASYQKAM